MVADSDELVVVYATDPRLDRWDDPTVDRQIEIVRIEHRDGRLHCPWLPGPIPDKGCEERPLTDRTVLSVPAVLFVPARIPVRQGLVDPTWLWCARAG